MLKFPLHSPQIIVNRQKLPASYLSINSKKVIQGIIQVESFLLFQQFFFLFQLTNICWGMCDDIVRPIEEHVLDVAKIPKRWQVYV